MSKNDITYQWECECSSKNSLRFRKCKSCGKDMPQCVLSIVYYEELKQQKALALIDDLRVSEKRCLCVGSLLEKMKNVVAPITLVLVIVLNCGRINLDGVNIGKQMLENVAGHQERLWIETDNIQGAMSGLKSTPLIAKTIFMDIVTKINDVAKGIVNNEEKSEKHIDYNKMEKAKYKIERGMEHVTNKFE